MLSPLASALRLASFVLCLIVVASFVVFAINQTSDASAHQQQELNQAAPATATNPDSAAPRTKSGKSSAHKALDEASDAITSPFSAASDATSSQWLKHTINLLLALLVYGFALAFLARVIRVRL